MSAGSRNPENFQAVDRSVHEQALERAQNLAVENHRLGDALKNALSELRWYQQGEEGQAAEAPAHDAPVVTGDISPRDSWRVRLWTRAAKLADRVLEAAEKRFPR